MGTLNRENGMNGYIKQRKWDKLLNENGMNGYIKQRKWDEWVH